MNKVSYPVVIIPASKEDGGGFIAYAPDLEGCLADGATREEALADLQGAIAEWLHEAKRLRRPIPQPNQATERAVRERGESRALIDAQAQLLQTQDELVKEQRTHIEHLREHIDRLTALDEDKNFPAYATVKAIGIFRSNKQKSFC